MPYISRDVKNMVCMTGVGLWVPVSLQRKLCSTSARIPCYSFTDNYSFMLLLKSNVLSILFWCDESRQIIGAGRRRKQISIPLIHSSNSRTGKNLEVRVNSLGFQLYHYISFLNLKNFPCCFLHIFFFKPPNCNPWKATIYNQRLFQVHAAFGGGNYF